MIEFFDFFSQADLTAMQWTLLALIVIGLPIEGEIALRLYKPRILGNRPDARLGTYFYAIVSLWAFALAVLVVWAIEGRSWAELGFRYSVDAPTLVVTALCAAIAGYFLVVLIQTHTNPTVRQNYRDALAKADGLHYFMPRKRSEYKAFMGLGVTAGITEEIIFRGFLIWALSHFMPIWVAASASWLLFVFMHRYQGLAGLAQVSVAGALLTAFYVASGSLYPLIALHIAVDVLNNAILWRARQPESASQEVSA